MKPKFIERLLAYFIDTLIVGILLSVICMGLPKSSVNSEEILAKLSEQLTKEEINTEEYLDAYSDLLYNNQKENMLQNGISLALTIAYFVIFQYMNKGQTVGKKLLKMRVVDKETNESPSILKGLVRSLFMLGIVTGALGIILINLLSKGDYLLAYKGISAVETIFVVVSIIFIIARSDGRGLHDLMAGTAVIKEGR